jgi:hypothetical protein
MHSHGTIQETMDIVKTARKGKYLDALKKHYTFCLNQQNILLNDAHATTYNPMFNTLVGAFPLHRAASGMTDRCAVLAALKGANAQRPTDRQLGGPVKGQQRTGGGRTLSPGVKRAWDVMLTTHPLQCQG